MWPFRKKQKSLQLPDDSRGWSRLIDWTPGAWQTHHAYSGSTDLERNSTVFACLSLISGDISKLPLSQQRKQGQIWVDSPSQPTILRRPNGYQSQAQFVESWILSKLRTGNSYILIERGERGISALHVLNPEKMTPLVSDSGEVFYRVDAHRLAGIAEQITLPSRSIIHDRFNTFFHPLVGLSPIFAAGAATLGLNATTDLTEFFSNSGKPSGVLTAPGPISEATAARLKEYWSEGFKGSKAGGLAVAGDGLKFEPLRMSAVDSQMVELLGWSAAQIASLYHVPDYMVTQAEAPRVASLEALQVQYYSTALQGLIEAVERSLGSALHLDPNQRIEADLGALLRMDSHTQTDSLANAVGAGLMAPNEGRARLNLPPATGGESPYLQQQNYSLEALARRDAPDAGDFERQQTARAKQELQAANDEAERLRYEYDRTRKQLDRRVTQIADQREQHAEETKRLRAQLEQAIAKAES